MQEMAMDEVNQVDGGVFPLAAAKIIGWAVGAAFGGGFVLAVHAILD